MFKIYSQYFLVQAFTVSLFICSISAYANDSTAAVGVGGITLLKSDEICMVKEVLAIAPSKISVQYQFLNESDKDIKNTIAFPTPSYTVKSLEYDDPNNHSLGPFHTLINGQEVPTFIYRRALRGDVDITNELRKIGLTDTQIFENFALCVKPTNSDENPEYEYCGLTPQQVDLLNKKKLGGWRVDETALWEYVFPAKKQLKFFMNITRIQAVLTRNHMSGEGL